jgi:hypothetical protein
MTQDFINERRYLPGASPKTLIWDNSAFKAFDGAPGSKTVISQRIVEIRDRGVRPVTVNSYLRALNAFIRVAKQRTGRGTFTRCREYPALDR